ncbi:hypothetical protein WMY93_032927, partial [Mugilogobius chulae]
MRQLDFSSVGARHSGRTTQPTAAPTRAQRKRGAGGEKEREEQEERKKEKSRWRRQMKLWKLVLLWTWSLTTGQEESVSCVHGQKCVLPCMCHGGRVKFIDWSKDDVWVHELSDINEKGEGTKTKEQDANFKGRTSLFPQEILKGNVSLQLSQVKVSDQGRYLCQAQSYTEYFTGKYIRLAVRAPVNSVLMDFKGDHLICSSENIYPEPIVSWSPDSAHQTQAQPMENQLFSARSSLSLKLRPPQQFTCNISTEHSWKSATYSLKSPVQMSSDVSLSCSSSSSARVKSLKWTFNSLETILTQTGADVSYSDTWRPFVERVSESGDLSLKNLSSKHQGVYLCEVLTQQHVHFSRTQLGQEP